AAVRSLAVSSEQQLPDSTLSLLASSQRFAEDAGEFQRWSRLVSVLAATTIGHLPSQDLADAWIQPAWLPADVLVRPEVEAVMAAYSAAARRSPHEMRLAAERVLKMPADAMAPE